MTASDVLHNAYTDAPELHPNLIMGSLQLLFWLFFHPSAWRNYVRLIDPNLRPDFCLAELTREHWRSPALRRLLLIGYIIWPILTGLSIGLMMVVLGYSAVDVAVDVGIGVGIGVASGVAVSVGIGVASGVTYGVASGVAVGVASCMAVGVAEGVAVCVASGVTYGVAGGIALGVSSSTGIPSLGRRIGAVVVGLLIGGVGIGVAFGVGVGVAYGVAYGVTYGVGVDVTIDVGVGVAVGVASGVASGMAFGIRARNWRRGLVYAVAVGVASGVGIGMASGVGIGMASGVGVGVGIGVAFGVATGILLIVLYTFSYLAAQVIAGPWAGTVAGTLAGGGTWIALLGLGLEVAFEEAIYWIPAIALGFVGIVGGLSLSWWRPVLIYPLQAAWNFLLLRREEGYPGNRSSLLRLNAAFWDEYQRLRLFGLDEHLVLVMERNPAEGQAAMEYLATSRQRWAAQAAQIELDARELEQCSDVMAIGKAHHVLGGGRTEGLVFPLRFPITSDATRSQTVGELEGPASALLRSFSRVSHDVGAALQQESVYNQRLALGAVEDRLDALLRELTRSSEPYAERFRPIAIIWRQTVADHVRKLAEAVEARQEIDNPYIIAVPLTAQQEIFVGRADISARIEQLLLDRRRPPLLLYGQRRMGKTSLLNNLGRLLPSTIVPLFVDLQGPPSKASDHTGFLYNLARSMVDSAEWQRGLALPSLTREAMERDPFTRFDEWLDAVEETLGQNLALLALDEFEALESAIIGGRFEEEAILGTLRHLIQHRSRFKVLIAGSHTLEEIKRWASYLINVQVVHISYLRESEARQLIERPIKDFALRYEPDASQRVLDITRGHPALVQLLCSEIVALKNEQPPAVRRLARLDDVEAAVPEALSSGSFFFFADIEQKQVDGAGLALLRFMAAQGEGGVVSRKALSQQFPDTLEHALGQLTRRELIEPIDHGYRFYVEMIRRWFAQ